MNYKILPREEKARLYQMATELRRESGWGACKIAKFLDLSPSLIRHWLYEDCKPHGVGIIQLQGPKIDFEDFNSIVDYFQERKLKHLEEVNTKELELILALRYHHKLRLREIAEITGIRSVHNVFAPRTTTRKIEREVVMRNHGWKWPEPVDEENLLVVLKQNWDIFNHFIGFFLCDGRAKEFNEMRQFSLHLKNGEDEMALLELYKRFFDNLPKHRKQLGNSGIHCYGGSYGFHPTNTLLAKFLLKHGFRKDKNRLNLPDWASLDQRSFGIILAGILDGDGTISYDKRWKRFKAEIVSGSVDFLLELKAIIRKFFEMEGNIWSKSRKAYKLSFGFSKQNPSKFEKFYNHVFPFLLLKRKRARITQLCAIYKLPAVKFLM